MKVSDLGLRIKGMRTLLKGNIENYGRYTTNIEEIFFGGRYSELELKVYEPDSDDLLLELSIDTSRTASCCGIIELQGLDIATFGNIYPSKLVGDVCKLFLDSIVEQYRILRDRSLEEDAEYQLAGGKLMINDTNDTEWAMALGDSSEWELIEEFTNPKTGNIIVWYKNID